MMVEPNDRKVPDLAPEDWAQVVQWRPLIYKVVRKFGQHVMDRGVFYRGRIGEPSFEWIVPQTTAYGEDAIGLLQDMEARALEEAAVAFARFDSEKSGGKPVSAKYLERVIWRGLQKEFDSWLEANHSVDTVQMSAQPLLYLDDGPTDDSRERHGQSIGEPWEAPQPTVADPPPVLDPVVEARLTNAMGELSSKEAWALRMVADGTPIDVIAERLGFTNVRSAHNLIAQARETAQKAYERDLP
jgi:hypothetical protein